jgi:streptomycin 6-kinase
VVEPTVPDVVREKALVAGADDWLRELPETIAAVEREWAIEAGAVYSGGTEALVVEATTGGGDPVVLKLCVPRDVDAARREIVALEAAAGRGAVRLLRHDVGRGVLLLERLGPSMNDIGLPVGDRHRILCELATAIWHPADGLDLPSGREKAEWLEDHVVRSWGDLGHPCSERAVEHAVACARRRAAAHDDSRAVLVHGDVHEWNALQRGAGWALVDPDGLVAEPEYDLGIIMREDPDELMRGDPRDRSRRLAGTTGCDEVAIWEWGVVERVSTGLLATRIGMQPVGRQMLEAADRIAERL